MSHYQSFITPLFLFIYSWSHPIKQCLANFVGWKHVPIKAKEVISMREDQHRGCTSTHIDITRSELESWARRRAVILQVSIHTFSHSVRTYQRVLAVNYKTLKKVRYDNKTDRNAPGFTVLHAVLSRSMMDLLLEYPDETFRFYLYASHNRAHLSTLLRDKTHIEF